MYIRSTLIIGGLFYFLLGLYGEDHIIQLTGQNGVRILYILFGISALYLCTNRDFYLPFLDEAVIPDGLFQPHSTPMSANLQHIIRDLPPLTKVIYWAAEPCEVTETCNKKRMPWHAYAEYTNAGVAMSDETGTANVHIRGKPQSYNVPYKSKIISPHIHYRYRLKNGMYSKVCTSYI